MNHSPDLQSYLDHQKKMEMLKSMTLLLERDEATHMPKWAGDDRADQSWFVSWLRHQYATDKTYAELIEVLSLQSDLLSSEHNRSVYLAKRLLDKQTKLSQEFVEEFSKAKSTANQVWLKAKEENNFEMFAPHLEKVFDMAREYAHLVAPDKEPYDVWLDEYEEGMNQEQYDKVLLPLQEPLTELIKSQPTKEMDPLYSVKKFDRKKCRLMFEELVRTVWFDLNRGLIWEVHHPFAELISPNDERINTNYSELVDSTYSLIHELGHGLYDQNGKKELQRTNAWYNSSLGMHESQSRLLENIIGKSPSFLDYLVILFQKYFPRQTKDFTVDGLRESLMHVNPSFIRIQADEVTYNMHILLRYQIEKWLMNGSIKVKDLPSVWNELMQKYLWITPATDTEWCLQDIHRGFGYIWYFPTYMLGNMISAQLFNSFEKDHPNRSQEIVKGNFASYKEWFHDKVWQHGGLYNVVEHVKRVTWESLNSDYFLDYLQKKYTP